VLNSVEGVELAALICLLFTVAIAGVVTLFARGPMSLWSWVLHSAMMLLAAIVGAIRVQTLTSRGTDHVARTTSHQSDSSETP
jgi:hypothetical protein